MNIDNHTGARSAYFQTSLVLITPILVVKHCFVYYRKSQLASRSVKNMCLISSQRQALIPLNILTTYTDGMSPSLLKGLYFRGFCSYFALWNVAVSYKQTNHEKTRSTFENIEMHHSTRIYHNMSRPVLPVNISTVPHNYSRIAQTH